MKYTQRSIGKYLDMSDAWVNGLINKDVMPRLPMPTLINLGHKTGFRIDEIPGMASSLFFSRACLMMDRANFGKTKEGKRLSDLRAKRDDLETTLRYVDVRQNPNLEHQLEQVKSEIITLAGRELTA